MGYFEGVNHTHHFGLPFYFCIHPMMQNYQIWRGNTWEGDLYLRDSHTTTPMGRTQCSPKFGVPIYLCIYNLSQNYQIRPRTTKISLVTRMGRGVLGGQPCHYICTSVLCGLSAIAQFLIVVLSDLYFPTHLSLNLYFCILWIKVFTFTNFYTCSCV